MNANELRIGNYYLWYDKPFQLTEEHLRDFRFWDEHFYYPMEDGQNYIRPIPLTDEYLWSMGFHSAFATDPQKIGPASKRFYIDRFEVYMCNEYIQEFLFEPNREFEMIEVKHVHQLQNIYYVITGNELTLKP